jgi:spermidine synthase
MSRFQATVFFFLSGLCALMYEILWTRQFSFILGNTYITISIIVASFMFGLFMGAWLIGKVIHKCENELRWYAYLELVIGIYALALLVTFGFTEKIYDLLYALIGNIDQLFQLGNSLITLLLLAIPTSAMGATLPLIVQYFTRSKKLFGDNISLFYSINTMGGAIGVILAGFFLIEYVGIYLGLVITAGINILIGISVLFLSGRKAEINMQIGHNQDNKKRKSKKPGRNEISKWGKWLYLCAAGLAGLTALSYEIIWIRGLRFLIHNSTYSFSVILFIFLLGIAVGGKLSKRIISQEKRLYYTYGVLQLVLGLWAILTIFLIYKFSYTDFFQGSIIEIIYDYSYGWFWIILTYVCVSTMLFLPPAIIMGILFPLINDIYYENAHEKSGKTVSVIFAINTIGAIIGSLAAGYFLLPVLGIRSSILLVSAINFLLGILFVMKSRYKPWLTFGLSAVCLFVIYNTSIDARYLYGRGEKKLDRILFYEEGHMATVKVFQRNNIRAMSVDGVKIASTGKSLLQKEKLIAHLPFFLKKDIRSVLSVGLASGISTGSMAIHKDVEKIDCVEIVKPVFPAARLFSTYSNDLFNNDKVNLYYNDIYAFMKYNKEEYDLISSDGKLGTLYSGNTIMLSLDYYQLCKKRLKANGLFIQWVPIITPHEILKEILETLAQPFEHVSLFYFYPSDVFMVASESPVVLDNDHTQMVLQEEEIAGDLKSLEIWNSFSILSSYIGDYQTNNSEETQIISFNKPILEFQYLRQWKDSRKHSGGFRAKNLQYLLNRYQNSREDYLKSKFKNVDIQAIYESLFFPSLNFFQFCVNNFKRGNYQIGLKEYREFKKNSTL